MKTIKYLLYCGVVFPLLYEVVLTSSKVLVGIKSLKSVQWRPATVLAVPDRAVKDLIRVNCRTNKIKSKADFTVRKIFFFPFQYFETHGLSSSGYIWDWPSDKSRYNKKQFQSDTLEKLLAGDYWNESEVTVKVLCLKAIWNTRNSLAGDLQPF